MNLDTAPGFANPILALLLLLLPLLPPLRGDVVYLLKKAYPGSRLEAAWTRMSGRPVSAPRRFSVLDAGTLIAAGMILVAAITGSLREVIAAGLAPVLLLLIMFDLRYRVLPDPLTLPLAIVGLAAAPILGPGFLQSVAGLVICGGGLWVLGKAFRRLRGIDGLGGGDIKLVAGMGAWLGLHGCLQAIAAAACAALAIETLVALWRHGTIDPRRRLPFGAYLAIAFWLTWCARLPA